MWCAAGVLVVLLPLSCEGFVPLQQQPSIRTRLILPAQQTFKRVGHAKTTPQAASNKSRLQSTTTVMMASAESNEENTLDKALHRSDLQQAVQILTQNPETELNRTRWNAIFSAIEETTANAEENTENLRAEFPLQSEARMAMTRMYETLQRGGHLSLYGAVNTKMPLAAGNHELPPALLESILEMPMKALTPKPTNSLVIAGVVVALIEGVLSTTLGISLNFLTFATLLAFLLDRLFLNGALSETFLKAFQPGVQNKILRHEAGHFLGTPKTEKKGDCNMFDREN